MIDHIRNSLHPQLARMPVDTGLPWPHSVKYSNPTPSSKAARAICEETFSGCLGCIHCPPPGHRCPQEDLGNSSTWRTRCHGVGCPRRKVETIPEEET